MATITRQPKVNNMEYSVKKTTLFIFIVLLLISFAIGIKLNVKASDNRKLFEKEMAFRLDMEEKVSKLRNENMELLTAIKNKDLELIEKDQLIASLTQSYGDQKGLIESLQLELKGMTLLKDQLEENLKTELSQRQ